MEGILRKKSAGKGIFKKWDDRFAFIKGLELHYQKKKGDSSSEKIIPLDGVDVLDASIEFKKKTNIILLFHPILRSYYFQATSEKQFKEWLDALRNAIPQSSSSKSNSSPLLIFVSNYRV